MNAGDILEFVQANKYWLVAAIPLVIAFVVIKILN
jgi:hypothetical protein